MTRSRLPVALALILGVGLPRAAIALSLSEAIALAQKANPQLAQSQAQAEAAGARVAQAQAGRLPSLVLSGEADEGRTDLGGFFGFGSGRVSPRAAALELRQLLFAGGAIGSAIDRSRNARDAALAQVGGARALVSAQVAEAYAGVLTAQAVLALHTAQLRQMDEIAGQAQLRFKGGETARTDLSQAQARNAEARAGLARAQGDVERARARFLSVVGVEPEGLEPMPPPPVLLASLDQALDLAQRQSPMILAAEAGARAATAGVRFAEAERAPNLALTATATRARDQFFPGYRSDGYAIGVQGRWTLFAGGAINGRVEEARAGERAARAGLAAARASVREAVIGAWSERGEAQAVRLAATDQAAAAADALEAVRHEVRVGQKPTLDLLNAEREALAAQSAVVAARGGEVSAAFRLNALLDVR